MIDIPWDISSELRGGETETTKVEKIETALGPHFQQLFVHAMAMPNKVDAFSELEKAVSGSSSIKSIRRWTDEFQNQVQRASA